VLVSARGRRVGEERTPCILTELTRTDENAGSALPLWAVVSPTRIYLVRAEHGAAAMATVGFKLGIAAVSRIEEAEISGAPTTYTALNASGERIRVTIPEKDDDR
jgi:hypothetical protein